MDSVPVYIRFKKHTLLLIDQLIQTRIYKDRQHFIEIAVLKEIESYERNRRI